MTIAEWPDQVLRRVSQSRAVFSNKDQPKTREAKTMNPVHAGRGDDENQHVVSTR